MRVPKKATYIAWRDPQGFICDALVPRYWKDNMAMDLGEYDDLHGTTLSQEVGRATLLAVVNFEPKEKSVMEAEMLYSTLPFDDTTETTTETEATAALPCTDADDLEDMMRQMAMKKLRLGDNLTETEKDTCTETLDMLGTFLAESSLYWDLMKSSHTWEAEQVRRIIAHQWGPDGLLSEDDIKQGASNYIGLVANLIEQKHRLTQEAEE